MNRDTLDLALASFSGRVPFRPFAIELMSGQQIAVRHPEAVAFWEELLMFRTERGHFQLFDPDSVCRLLDTDSPAGGA